MTLAALASVEVESLAPTRLHDGYAYHHSQSSEASASLANQYGEGKMSFANAPIPRRMRGEHSADIRCATREATDWLRSYLTDKSAKDIADDTGSSVRAAENIKQGRNGMTMAHIVSMCRADPYFRAEFFRFAGGELEADPQIVGALSHAINAVMQRKQIIGKGEE